MKATTDFEVMYKISKQENERLEQELQESEDIAARANLRYMEKCKELEQIKHERTAYKTSLENLEASIPKIKADAFEEGAYWERDCSYHADVGSAADEYANKLEAGE